MRNDYEITPRWEFVYGVNRLWTVQVLVDDGSLPRAFGPFHGLDVAIWHAITEGFNRNTDNWRVTVDGRTAHYHSGQTRVNRPLSQAAVSARLVPPPSLPDPQPLANEIPIQEQASRSFTLGAEAQQPASAEALPVASVRSEPPRLVQSSARIPLAAIVAGFAIGAGAGYYSIYGYQGRDAWQSASSPEELAPATMYDAGSMPVPVFPATLADPSVPPPSSERATPAHNSAPPLRSPTRTQNARAAQAGPKARQAPVKSVSIASVAVMHRELNVCRQESFFSRVVCTEKVRWKYCAPNRWNTIPECATDVRPL